MKMYLKYFYTCDSKIKTTTAEKKTNAINAHFPFQLNTRQVVGVGRGYKRGKRLCCGCV